MTLTKKRHWATLDKYRSLYRFGCYDAAFRHAALREAAAAIERATSQKLPLVQRTRSPGLHALASASSGPATLTKTRRRRWQLSEQEELLQRQVDYNKRFHGALADDELAPQPPRRPRNPKTHPKPPQPKNP
eukprot:jgi/Tetstr1/465855/TSEL_010474.t1